jgi:small GTP-binding protein
MKIVQKKICLLGDYAVGKTSLTRRFVEGRFDDKYLSTIGVKVSRRLIEREDHSLNLLIWDLVGGNELSQRETGYLVGAAGALIVCDLTRPETVETLKRYAHHLRVVSPAAALVFIGNKLDLTAERMVTDDTLTAVSAGLQAEFQLTSAKTGQNVAEAFLRLAEKMEAS